MRFITRIKHFLAVGLLKLLGADIDAMILQHQQDLAAQMIAKVQSQLKLAGTLTVVDKFGNVK